MLKNLPKIVIFNLLFLQIFLCFGNNCLGMNKCKSGILLIL